MAIKNYNIMNAKVTTTNDAPADAHELLFTMAKASTLVFKEIADARTLADLEHPMQGLNLLTDSMFALARQNHITADSMDAFGTRVSDYLDNVVMPKAVEITFTELDLSDVLDETDLATLLN